MLFQDVFQQQQVLSRDHHFHFSFIQSKCDSFLFIFIF